MSLILEKEDNFGEIFGTCKWFNNKLGYGFITIIEGTKKGKDVFVHHTCIKPTNSLFKSLVKGEYVNFDMGIGINGEQAVNITGIFGGPLQCDHIYEQKTYSKMHKNSLRRTKSF